MSKPAFDPSASFEPVDAPSPVGKPAFDQNASFDVPDAAPSGPSKMESAGRGYAQGSTFGFSDEGGAGLYAALDKYLPESIKTAISGRNPNLEYKAGDDKLADIYKLYRDKDRASNAEAQKANPATYGAGELAGGVMTSSLVPGATGIASLGAQQGAVGGLGFSNADNVKDMAIDTAIGGALGVGGGLAAKGVEKGAKYLAPKIGETLDRVGNSLRNKAGELAENATGATGKQLDKFADGAGNELLDRGLIKFGDSSGNIATRVGKAVDNSSGEISEALTALDGQGGHASVENIVDSLQGKIAELKLDPSKAAQARKLETIVQDIIDTENANVGLGEAENVKRGFGQKIKNWMDPEQGAANKDAYLAYRDEVERGATELNPGLADKFKQAKKDFGLLAPIEEAAEKRAAVQSQSPYGGLGDIASTAAAGGNPLGAVARRIISPRLASSGAVLVNNFANVVKSTPHVFGKYASVLQNAAQRGPQGLAATNFLLQQTDEGYRKILNQVADTDQKKDKEEGF